MRGLKMEYAAVRQDKVVVEIITGEQKLERIVEEEEEEEIAIIKEGELVGYNIEDTEMSG
jgi:hypothetical protein